MNMSEAGRMGWLKSKEKREANSRKIREEYAKNPKVCDCGKIITFEKRKNDSCSQSCASVKRNTGVRRHGNPPRKCERCGLDTRNPKFCSNACQQAFEWEKVKEGIERTGICPKSNRVIRRYLLEKYGCRCSVCNGTEWQGKPMPLEVDHIDGNWKDHRIVNVRMVCGNCGMQLPTYKGKNRGNGRFIRRERYAQGKSY